MDADPNHPALVAHNETVGRLRKRRNFVLKANCWDLWRCFGLAVTLVQVLDGI